MSDFQDGRCSGIFSAGVLIEGIQAELEKQTVELTSMEKAFKMCYKALIDYKSQMLRELNDSKISVKEVEYGKTYVNRSSEIVKKLLMECETKRISTDGAKHAMTVAVSSLKKTLDEETKKKRFMTNSLQAIRV